MSMRVMNLTCLLPYERLTMFSPVGAHEQSKMMQYWLQRYGRTAGLDATYKTNKVYMAR